MSIPASAAVLPQNPEKTAVLPRHLVRLPGTGWNLWRTVAVRGAGFPARMMEGLVADGASAAADRYLACRTRASRLGDAALQRISIDLRAPEFRRQRRAFRAAILAGKPEQLNGNADAVAAATAYAEAAAARSAFETAFAVDDEAVSSRLVELSRDPRFREAMLWQSRAGTRQISHELRSDERPAVRRYALRQIALRAQRYCLKNDSIGFFGPVGWAGIDENSGLISVEPGPGLIAHREVFFEGWSMDALAACLDSEKLRPWIAPRIKSGVWIDGARAYRPRRKELPLSAPELAVLLKCDGLRTALEVAQVVLAHPAAPALGSEREVFEVLEQLVVSRLIAWNLEVASQQYPERELAVRLSRIGDPVLRKHCETALEELLQARDRAASAAGDDGALDEALGALDAAFTRLTARPSSRLGGKTYAGRTLIYEDCRRDCEIRIGTAILEDLAQPLSVVLDAARWAAAEIGDRMNEQLLHSLAQLKEKRRGEIDCQLFLEYVAAMVWPEGKSPMIDAAVERFRALWESALGHPKQVSQGRAAYSASEVRARADKLFPAREVGWSLGRYVSPDLMLSATSVEAIRRGEYTGILGEVHFENTIDGSIFTTQHPDPQQLMQATATDMADELVVHRQRAKSMWLARTNHVLIPPDQWRYQFGDDPPNHPLCRPLPAGMLIVTGVGDSVKVRARDSSIEFNALELFAGHLADETARVLAGFRPQSAHTPRVSIGNLVVVREHWNLMIDAMSFLNCLTAADQFLEVRAWARGHGMPRLMFVSSPAERKPWFLDLDSPVSISVFASRMKNLDGGTAVGLTEMLPDLSNLWLFDRSGDRFTSELRLVARAAG
ncbi:MAG: lantibiotic dehydratase family protein [Acidobacteriia bacterium]|nr:lantibiotic dehydratase family protein [Terriglobia bacterium]